MLDVGVTAVEVVGVGVGGVAGVGIDAEHRHLVSETNDHLPYQT